MTALTVGLDVTPTIQGATGIARYARAIARHLTEVDVTVTPFTVGRATIAPDPGVRHIAVPGRVLDPMWRVVRRPRAERLVGAIDLVHGTALPPPPSRRPRLVTVHDLTPLHHPELHDRRTVGTLHRLLAQIPRVAGVLADSATVADELEERGVGRDRITVAPIGRTSLPPPVDPEVDLTKWVLAVGETNRRKNLGLLVDALSRSTDDDLGLVIAGPAGNDDARLRVQVAARGLGHRVRFLGPVSDARLAGLYRDALVLGYVSIAEGFGLPVLEAMAAGCPVVCSDLPVLREVGGWTVLAYVASDDADSLASALDDAVALADDPARSAALVASGQARAATFTWHRCAELTRTAYMRALA